MFEDAIVAWAAEAGEPPERLLDAGCGDGINLIGLGEIAGRLGLDIEMHGVDYNPLRVERAAQLPGVRAMIQARLDALPYPDGCFDVVLCNHVIEHITADQAVLQSLRRVTAAGGLLIVGVPNEGCFMGRLRNHLLQRSVLRKTDHVHFYTSGMLSDLVLAPGFSLMRLERSGFLTPHGAAHYVLTATRLGRGLLRRLGSWFPSQSADLILVARRD
jgi:SAM-dependent methyltransferase